MPLRFVEHKRIHLSRCNEVSTPGRQTNPRQEDTLTPLALCLQHKTPAPDELCSCDQAFPESAGRADDIHVSELLYL